MARHVHTWHVVHGRGRWLAPRRQPAFHKLYFVCLRPADARAERAQFLVVRVSIDERSHLNRLSMMHDHVLHELRVCRRMWR